MAFSTVMMVGSFTSNTAQEIVAPKVYAAPVVETLREKTQSIASKYEVPFDVMDKIITSETHWRPEAIGDKGCSVGLVQINLCVHKDITKEQALDPDFALNFLASEIKAGREWQWTICSCTATVRLLGAPVPFKDKLVPNEFYPRVGGVIIAKYGELRHLSYITKVTPEGIWVEEANFTRCERGIRLVKFDDSHTIGYWHAEE